MSYHIGKDAIWICLEFSATGKLAGLKQ